MKPGGFSIIECAIALVLLSAGLLSVAVTARAGNRLAARARLNSGAVELAYARLTRLEADGCLATSGSALSGRYAERWSVQPERGLRLVTFTVSADWQGRTAVWSFQTAVLCAAELP
jgi:hypothetical protein